MVNLPSNQPTTTTSSKTSMNPTRNGYGKPNVINERNSSFGSVITKLFPQCPSSIIETSPMLPFAPFASLKLKQYNMPSEIVTKSSLYGKQLSRQQNSTLIPMILGSLKTQLTIRKETSTFLGTQSSSLPCVQFGSPETNLSSKMKINILDKLLT